MEGGHRYQGIGLMYCLWGLGASEALRRGLDLWDLQEKYIWDLQEEDRLGLRWGQMQKHQQEIVAILKQKQQQLYFLDVM